MKLINFYNILNSIDNFLEKNTSSYVNSSIDNFIDDLKSYLAQSYSLDIPKDSILVLDRYEGNYAVCEEYATGKMFDIPRLKIDPYAKDGDLLKLDNNFYVVDNTLNKNIK